MFTNFVQRIYLRHGKRHCKFGTEFGRSMITCNRSIAALHIQFRASQKLKTRLWAFSREVDFMRWLPVAFLANGVSIVIRVGFEVAIPLLSQGTIRNNLEIIPRISSLLTGTFSCSSPTWILFCYSSSHCTLLPALRSLCNRRAADKRLIDACTEVQHFAEHWTHKFFIPNGNKKLQNRSECWRASLILLIEFFFPFLFYSSF